jgi:hypothetical protein
MSDPWFINANSETKPLKVEEKIIWGTLEGSASAGCGGFCHSEFDFLLCMPVIPAIFYLLTGFAGCSVSHGE